MTPDSILSRIGQDRILKRMAALQVVYLALIWM